MKLTALEIRKHEFGRGFRGYDPEEVDAFLNMVAQHWQTMNQDLRRLEDRLEEQTQRVNHYLKVEEALENALENARTIAQEKLEAAEEEASETLRAARASAEKTTHEAEWKAAEAVREAEARARELLDRSERQLGEIGRRANEARSAALREFQQLEGDRRRVLDRFREFLTSEMEALRQFEATEPPVPTFTTELPAEPVVESVVPPQGESEPDPELEVSHDSPADHIDPDSSEAADSARTDAEESGDDGGGTEEFLLDLPSADDGFEEDSLKSSRKKKADSGQQAELLNEERDFGAEEEIRKIRRILEDLDG